MRPLFPVVFSLTCLAVFVALGSPAQALPPVVAVAQNIAAQNAAERCGLGSLQGLPTSFPSTTLGTTPVKVTLASTAAAVCIKVMISNPSTTATIAWNTVVSGATAPTAGNMTADYAATGATPVFSGSQQIFAIQPGRDLYIVASAASTSVNATSFVIE
jgi:hypothetical protein